MSFDFNKADKIFGKLPIEAQNLVRSGQYSFLHKDMKEFVLLSKKGTIYRIDPETGNLDIETKPKLTGFTSCITTPTEIEFSEVHYG